MAKKTLLTASQIQSVEPYIQNVLIEDKSASLLQGSLVQVCETLTQEISGEESKLLLPSIESSTTETQGILISERPSDSLITTFPTDVEIIYVPNITPVLPRTYLAKPVFSEFVVKQPKPCVTCEGPTAWGVTSQSQSPPSTPPPIYAT